jgi:hypothetical protein
VIEAEKATYPVERMCELSATGSNVSTTDADVTHRWV